MKKSLVLSAILIANANAFYLDAGIGVGSASTEISIDGQITELDDTCIGCNDLGVDFGIRVGGNISSQFILAGELLGYGHRYYDSREYIQFNSYLVGPSAIFYPTPTLQLSASIGYSFTANSSSLPMYFYDGSGVALSTTVAYSSPATNGVLIGARIFYSANTLDVSNADQNTFGINFIIRYVRRDLNTAARNSSPATPIQDNTSGSSYEVDYGDDEY